MLKLVGGPAVRLVLSRAGLVSVVVLVNVFAVSVLALQAAAAVGMAFDADYYNHLSLDYRARRDALLPVLQEAGFTFSTPEGAYYVLADFSALSDKDDTTFAKWLTAEVGVAGVPGSSFYSAGSGRGKNMIRFAFCKKQETLDRAAERLAGLAARV